MGYYFPEVPGGSAKHTLELTLTSLFAALIVASFVYALVRWRRNGSPLGVVLLLGAVAASLNEGLVDSAGLCWYPQQGQLTGYSTIHAVPVWVVLAYASYFGAGTYVLYERAGAGMTRRALWTVLAGLCASEIVVEIAVINLGGYSYFGNQPFVVGGLPLHWLALNFPGMFAAVALLVRMPQLFAGWRVLFAVVVPGVMYAVGAFGAGWPVFSALHLDGASPVLISLAGVATIGLGVAMLVVTIGIIAADGPLGRPAAPAAKADDRDRLNTLAR